MTNQYVTDLPFGYDEHTTMALGPQNQIIITHPVMPAMVYDEQVMRWVELSPDVAVQDKLNGI
jgi:hypothetical protein